MNCPFCSEKMNEGDLKCPGCRRRIIDTNYFDNMDKIEEKYGKTELSHLSREKLDFEEVVTILTLIDRVDRHCGDSSLYSQCREDGTFSNLRNRLRELKKNQTSKDNN